MCFLVSCARRYIFGRNSVSHIFRFCWLCYVLRNAFNRKLLHIYYLVAKAKIPKLMKNDKFFFILFILRIQSALAENWSDVQAFGLFMTSLNFSLNQDLAEQMNFIAVLSNHICDLWTASATTIFYSKFLAKPDVSFPVKSLQIGMLYLALTWCIRMVHFKMNVNVDDERSDMACMSRHGMDRYFWVESKNLWPEHKIVSSHLISHVNVWRMHRLQIAPKIHGTPQIGQHSHSHAPFKCMYHDAYRKWVLQNYVNALQFSALSGILHGLLCDYIHYVGHSLHFQHPKCNRSFKWMHMSWFTLSGYYLYDDFLLAVYFFK